MNTKLTLSVDDVAFLHAAGRWPAPIQEAYKGTDVVSWWGGINRAIKSKINTYAEHGDGNSAEIRELEAFLRVWNDNPLSGSISKSTLKTLSAAAAIAAAQEKLGTANFFSHVRDQLNKLTASVEELPAIPSSTGRDQPRAKAPTGLFSAEKEPQQQPAEVPVPEKPKMATPTAASAPAKQTPTPLA